MKMFLVLVITLSFLIFSCEKSPVENDVTSITGAWISDNSGNIFYKSNGLDSNKFGFIFYENGTMTDRNPGPCLTPPLSFHNYHYEWQWENDSIIATDNGIEIPDSVFSWRDDYKIKIISLTDNILEIQIIDNF